MKEAAIAAVVVLAVLLTLVFRPKNAGRQPNGSINTGFAIKKLAFLSGAAIAAGAIMLGLDYFRLYPNEALAKAGKMSLTFGLLYGLYTLAKWSIIKKIAGGGK